MKNYNPSEVENMMIEILSDGEKEVLKEIEQIKNAFKRFYLRNLYFEALEKIEKGQ